MRKLLILKRGNNMAPELRDLSDYTGNAQEDEGKLFYVFDEDADIIGVFTSAANAAGVLNNSFPDAIIQPECYHVNVYAPDEQVKKRTTLEWLCEKKLKEAAK